MIHFADDRFGGFLDLLKEEGLYEESIVAVTGDHGEAFGEHGNMSHAGPPFEEEIHVPLFVKSPDLTLTGNVKGVVETIDIYPTLLGLAGVSASSPFVQGRRLCDQDSLNDTEDTAFSTLAFNESEARYRSVRTPTHKYHRIESPVIRSSLKGQALRFRYQLSKLAMNHPFLYRLYLWLYSTDFVKNTNTFSLFKLFDVGRAQTLYNLETDPGEQQPIYEATIASNLQEKLSNNLESCRGLSSSIDNPDEAAMGPEVRDQLKAMGYID